MTSSSSALMKHSKYSFITSNSPSNLLNMHEKKVSVLYCSESWESKTKSSSNKRLSFPFISRWLFLHGPASFLCLINGSVYESKQNQAFSKKSKFSFHNAGCGGCSPCFTSPPGRNKDRLSKPTQLPPSFYHYNKLLCSAVFLKEKRSTNKSLPFLLLFVPGAVGLGEGTHCSLVFDTGRRCVMFFYAEPPTGKNLSHSLLLSEESN